MSLFQVFFARLDSNHSAVYNASCPGEHFLRADCVKMKRRNGINKEIDTTINHSALALRQKSLNN